MKNKLSDSEVIYEMAKVGQNAAINLAVQTAASLKWINYFTPKSFAVRVTRYMRENKITIKAFSQFAGVSQARVRELRTTGRADYQEEWLITLRECVAATSHK